MKYGRYLLLGAWLLPALVSCGDVKETRQEKGPVGQQGARPGGEVKLMPARPTSADCLSAITPGGTVPGQYQWLVNGQVVAGYSEARLCGSHFKRGDEVSVRVGTANSGNAAAVTIANSPPEITGVSATPEQVFAGSEIQVTPVAEDNDKDPVEFRYQWLVNGEVDAFLTEAVMPGDRFKKGDVIQVKITSFDGIDEGQVYESYKMTVPNAPPRIESSPPQKFEALEYSYQPKATDPDDDSLVWRLDKAPQGMTINPSNGLINWPLTGATPGAYPMKIVVSDPDGAEAFQEFTLTLGAPK